MKFNTYQKVALTTLGATIFLIFVGGLVRASGAGLGCPDWPKCFGLWIPPTAVSELPAGFETSQFNVLKTWTEYINRLVGVLIGLLITATFVLSFRYRKNEPSVFYSSGAAFLLVLLQGWLGGRVVMTGLDEWLITLHMLLAMLIMMTLIYAVFKASRHQVTIELAAGARRVLFWSGILLLLLTFVQLIMGTQVREAVDVLKNMADSPPREMWIANTGAIDEWHRSFSWAILGASAVVFYIAKWQISERLVTKIASWIAGLVVLQVITGAGLYYLGMPPVYQVIHLLGIAVIIALEFGLLLLAATARKVSS